MKAHALSIVLSAGILITMLCTPGLAIAQKWHFSAGGGVSFISKPASLHYFENSRTRPSAALGLNLSRDISRRLCLGIDAAVMNMVRTGMVTEQNYVGYWVTFRRTSYLGYPNLLVTPSLSYNYHRFYFGPQAGIVFSWEGPGPEGSLFENEGIYYKSNIGYCLGAHAGYRQKITKHFDAFAEVRGNGVFASTGDYFSGPNVSYTIIQTQFTIGARISY